MKPLKYSIGYWGKWEWLEVASLSNENLKRVRPEFVAIAETLRLAIQEAAPELRIEMLEDDK